MTDGCFFDCTWSDASASACKDKNVSSVDDLPLESGYTAVGEVTEVVGLMSSVSEGVVVVLCRVGTVVIAVLVAGMVRCELICKCGRIGRPLLTVIWSLFERTAVFVVVVVVEMVVGKAFGALLVGTFGANDCVESNRLGTLVDEGCG